MTKTMTWWTSSVVRAATALLLQGCSHSSTMTDDPPSSSDPVDPGPPVQLTINPGDDVEVAMLSNTEITYSYTVAGTPDRDRCIAVLPLSGGTRLREICAQGDHIDDSTHAYRFSTPLPSDSLAWFRGSRRPGEDFNREALVAVASWANPNTFRVLRTFPTTSTNSQTHIEPAFLRSIGAGKLAYVGMRFLMKCTPLGCELIFAGREIALLDLTQPGTPPLAVPSTNYPTSVAAGPNPGEIIYTLVGDSRVYLQTAGGSIAVLHDFGPSGIARDAHLAGGRLAAIVGGVVSVDTSDTNEPFQRDAGGPLIVVDLTNGEELPVMDEFLVRRPVLTPDGRHVVAELAGNLYRFDLP